MRYLTTLGIVIFVGLIFIDRMITVPAPLFIPLALIAIACMVAGAVYAFKNRRRR